MFGNSSLWIFFFFWFKLDDVIQNCELCISKKGLLCMEMLKVA